MKYYHKLFLLTLSASVALLSGCDDYTNPVTDSSNQTNVTTTSESAVPIVPVLQDGEQLIQVTPHYLLLKVENEYRVRITDSDWLNYRNLGISVDDRYDTGFYYDSLLDMQEGLLKGNIDNPLNLVKFFYKGEQEDDRMLCNLDRLYAPALPDGLDVKKVHVGPGGYGFLLENSEQNLSFYELNRFEILSKETYQSEVQSLKLNNANVREFQGGDKKYILLETLFEGEQSEIENQSSIDIQNRIIILGEEKGQYFQVTIEHPVGVASDEWASYFGIKETEFGLAP